MTIMVREGKKQKHFKENTDRLRLVEEGLIEVEEGLIELEEVPIRVNKNRKLPHTVPKRKKN